VPVTAKLAMFKAAFPWLVRVTGCTALVVPRVWLLKIRLVAVRLTAGALPVPARFTVCGLNVALSVMATAAVRVPEAPGVKVTLIAQVPPAATERGERGQLLVSTKSPALVPATAKLVMLKGVFPSLVRMTAWAVLVVPTV